MATEAETIRGITHLPQVPINDNSPICQVDLEPVPLTNTGTHERTVRSLGWSADGTFLAAASFDATASVWRERNVKGVWMCRAKIEGHENEVRQQRLS